MMMRNSSGDEQALCAGHRDQAALPGRRRERRLRHRLLLGHGEDVLGGYSIGLSFGLKDHSSLFKMGSLDMEQNQNGIYRDRLKGGP